MTTIGLLVGEIMTQMEYGRRIPFYIFIYESDVCIAYTEHLTKKECICTYVVCIN